MAQNNASRTKRNDFIVVFISVLGAAIAFLNIYKFANDRQPGNALWAGIGLYAFSLLLATQLAAMRHRKE